MRILLQKKDNGFYFKERGAWTPAAADAMDFLCSTRAIDFCLANRISDVQIVLKFHEQRYDIVLPMAAEQSGPAPRPSGAL
ncbi:MAG: hypothetical protein EXS35_13185 [Pedosphaera sp.]|nr:hypothetical protein [Pedosphaera sp.]